MSILSERSFRDLMDKLLVVHPSKPENMTGVGYDLDIGFYIQINRHQNKIVSIKEVKDGDKGIIHLNPDHSLVVITREYVYLSSRVAATFHAKSTLAAQAIFINSTTCDPNWDGRLIFLLYNAGGSSVGIRIDESFTTMVVHKTERRSFLMPKESKKVLDKYIEGFGKEVASAVPYVLKNNQEYIKRVDKAKKFAGHSTPFILFLIFLYRYKAIFIRTFIFLILCFSISLIIMSPEWVKEFGLNEKFFSILGSISSIFSGMYLLIEIIKTIAGKFRTKKISV